MKISIQARETPISMNNIIKLERHMKFVHEVEIETTPLKIWKFLLGIENNYIPWHPIDHILFKWKKGEPFALGSIFYSEQFMMNEKVAYKGTITESIPNNKITMKFAFPISIITNKIEMIIEDHGSHSTFKHITYMNFKFLSRTVFRKRNIDMLKSMDAHIKTESQNMKRILEGK